jgi:hypothetical protein
MSKVPLHSQFGSMKWKLHIAKKIVKIQMTFEWKMQYNVIGKLCSKIIIFHLRTLKLKSMWRSYKPKICWDSKLVSFGIFLDSHLGWNHGAVDQSGTWKVHTRIDNFFNPFVSPFTIPTFTLYSFFKVHNFL